MKKFCDRKDAKRIKNISGLEQISIDLKPNRSISDVYINYNFDVSNLCNYVDELKSKGKDITYFHAFVMAIGKLLYNRNKLNRFVANRHVYEHNEVIVSFVAKTSFSDNAGEMMILIPIEKDDTLESVSKKIRERVSSVRDNKEVVKEGANNAISILGKLPNVVRIPIVGLFKWCDRLGILPSSLIHDNLYYSSIIVSNLGSIKCGAIFHNINDFGTCSSLATMGEIKEEVIIDNDKKSIRKVCEFGINLDERIADGFYFAKSLNLLQYIFDNPNLLEECADAKVNINKD